MCADHSLRTLVTLPDATSSSPVALLGMLLWPGRGRGQPVINHFEGPEPQGRRGKVIPTPPLPVEGSVELGMSVDHLWEAFLDVEGWPRRNQCFWRSGVRGGKLRLGATLVWAFNPIKPGYLYRLPAVAEVVELEPHDRVTWEVSLPGFHAVHAYRFARLGAQRCRFGSWEVADGRGYGPGASGWRTFATSAVARWKAPQPSRRPARAPASREGRTAFDRLAIGELTRGAPPRSAAHSRPPDADGPLTALGGISRRRRTCRYRAALG